LLLGKGIHKWKSYELCWELADLSGGAETHMISKVPVSELTAWDATHDAVDRLYNTEDVGAIARYDDRPQACLLGLTERM
jgi:hypothetical protein